MIGTMFAPLEGMHRDEVIAGDTRVFVGDGTSYVKVAGLQELQGVRIGSCEIPLEAPFAFPEFGNLPQKVRTSWPLVTVAIDPSDDTPVLIRSQQSNDGIWQQGERIFVRGVWDAAVAKQRKRLPLPDDPGAPSGDPNGAGTGDKGAGGPPPQ
jgi:hypothetical protein